MRYRKQRLNKQYLIAAIAMLAALIVCSGCSEENNTSAFGTKNNSEKASKMIDVYHPEVGLKVEGDTNWKFDNAIDSPLEADLDRTTVTLGNLDTNNILVRIPKKTFSSNASITIKNPDPNKVPKVDGKLFRPIGAPIEIKAVGEDNHELLRTNEPVTITMKVDANRLERDFDRASVQIAYYNGLSWEFMKPGRFDLDSSTITFNTYCLGMFGYGKVSVEEQINEYVHRRALTGKALVKSLNYEIPIWRYAEIDAAYRAYINGADGAFWGYQNNAGDFDRVWNQMFGFGYQLENEVIRWADKSRKNSNLLPLTTQETARIRTEVRNSMKKQFDSRIDNEKAISRKKNELRNLIDAFRNANLMHPGIFGYDLENETLDSRLDNLFHLKDKILRDTERKQVTGSAATNEEALSVGDLVILSQMWYSKDGRPQYERYLWDEFGIDISN